MITKYEVNREINNGIENPAQIVEDMYLFINKILKSKSLDEINKYKKQWEHVTQWEY
jgi:hypothetical protein